MDFDFSHSDFPGMYSADNSKKNDSDFSDDNNEKLSKKELLIVKRKDKKDKGYATLEGESSPEDEVEAKSPFKSRKTKAFKFSSKKEKREKSREKENKESEKDKKKEKEKQKVKVKDKDKKKVKNAEPSLDISEELPIFGVPLNIAVQRNPCHDGPKIPLVIRNCIDYVQEHGLLTDGVYKMPEVKSRVQHVYGLYNKRKTVYESDFDIQIATNLLKQFLRLLPEPILTNQLLNKFDDPAATKDVASVRTLVDQLPECNRDMLRWLFTHFRHVCANEKSNKMNTASLGAIFCPLLQINVRLFANLISWSEELFPNTTLGRYVPPLRCVSPNMPTTLETVSVELTKQESLLGQIHFEMNAGFVSKEKEDELWGVQRNITNLKRKLKSLERDLQQKLAKMQVESCPDADKDDDAETATNVSDNSGSVVTEKCVDTTPSVNESIDKKIYYESSQENLNQPASEDSEDEEKCWEFESDELVNLVKTLQEEIKTERLKIHQLEAELHASKLETTVVEYFTGVPEESCIDEKSQEGFREYNILQVQKKNLLRSIMEEREMIIDLKIQIRMAQHKYKQTTNLH